MTLHDSFRMISDSWKALASLGLAVIFGMAVAGFFNVPERLEVVERQLVRQAESNLELRNDVSRLVERMDRYLCLVEAERAGNSPLICR